VQEAVSIEIGDHELAAATHERNELRQHRVRVREVLEDELAPHEVEALGREGQGVQVTPFEAKVRHAALARDPLAVRDPLRRGVEGHDLAFGADQLGQHARDRARAAAGVEHAPAAPDAEQGEARANLVGIGLALEALGLVGALHEVGAQARLRCCRSARAARVRTRRST
jgi:hypothetical protein